MSDEVPALPVGTLVAGKLRVVRALGVGGMGTVYEVEHELTRHRRALKLLHPEFATNQQAVTRFLREASAAGRIGSEHIVETFDAGVLDTGEPYLVMELLQGQSLADILDETGRIPEKDAIAWLAQACDGLQAAHDAGIVHRDIKPDNLFIERSGRVKLLDFGISKFDPSLTGEQQLTGDLTLGTPYYMAPEQTMKNSSVDQRTDVYAMGVVLYECVTGAKPFTAETYPQLIVQIHLGDYAPASSISVSAAALDGIIAKAMARKPGDRFQTPAALAAALRDVGLATERTQSPFESTRRAGDLQALLEQHKVPRPPLELAATERPLEPTVGIGGTQSPRRDSSPASPVRASNAPAAYDATLVSAGSEPPSELRPRSRRPWLILAALAVLAGGASLWWSVRGEAGGRSTAAPAPAGATPLARTPAVAAVETTPSITALAPAPSDAPLAPVSSGAHPALPVQAPATAKSGKPTLAGQHGLEQENPFK